MNQQIDAMLKGLSTFDIPIYENDIAEDEETKFKKDGYHFFIYQTGDMFNNDDKLTVEQDIAIFYFSENRDDLDEQTTNIIKALSNIPAFKFERTQKNRLRKKNTDEYVDQIVLFYNRLIKLSGCVLK